MENLRIRLHFDRHVLHFSQKCEGLKRCWLYVKPEFKSISDIASNIIRNFNVAKTCPYGISLSMDGFVLPPFESTAVLKDKDIIRVKAAMSKDDIRIADEENQIQDSVIPGKELATVLKIVAPNGSDFEENGTWLLEDTQHLNSPVSLKADRKKKRKISDQLPKSKRKKPKLVTPENTSTFSVEYNQNHVDLEKNVRCNDKIGHDRLPENDNSSLRTDKMNTISAHEEKDGLQITFDAHLGKKRENQLQQDDKNVADSSVPGGTIKVPSRSARRKKAKRKWLRERTKSQKEETIPCQASKGYLPMETLECTKTHPVSNGKDGFVPVIVRPGHIRFEPLDEGNGVQPPRAHVDTLKWNGITDKKKGQKWGREKPSRYQSQISELSSETCDREIFSSDESNHVEYYVDDNIVWCKENPSIQKQHLNEVSGETSDWKLASHGSCHSDYLVDFEKLTPFSGLPKEGDVIAYHLVELSSSWCPVLSPFKVGRISSYDSSSGIVTLYPVLEYVISHTEKIDERSNSDETNMLPYKEDGSLEVEFSSLIDVRLINTSKNNPEGITSVEDGTPEIVQDPTLHIVPNVINAERNTSITEEGTEPVPGWEEINKILTEKKEQLLQKDGTTLKETTSKPTRSYRSLKCNGLGSTIALLRAQSNS